MSEVKTLGSSSMVFGSSVHFGRLSVDAPEIGVPPVSMAAVAMVGVWGRGTVMCSGLVWEARTQDAAAL